MYFDLIIENNNKSAFWPYGNRFGMVLNVRRSEQWEGIKQERVSWHGILAFWLQEAGIGTYFSMT